LLSIFSYALLLVEPIQKSHYRNGPNWDKEIKRAAKTNSGKRRKIWCGTRNDTKTIAA
jgi:hypothetical protein